MGRAVTEEEEDIVSLMAAAGVPDELIHVYLDTGKISQSIADKVFKGKVPDKYKDIIVSDEEFKKLMEKANKSAEAAAKAEEKKEAKLEMPTEEIPSISEVKEEKAQPQEQPKEEDKIVKTISKSLDINEVATQIMLQRLQSLASKGNNINEVINTLANLKRVGGEVTNKSTDIATSQIVRRLIENLNRNYNRMSPQDIIDYVLALKFLSSLEDKGEKGEEGA